MTDSAEIMVKNGRKRQRHRLILMLSVAGIALLCLGWTAWLSSTSVKIKSELEAASALIPALKAKISSADQAGALSTVSGIRSHTLTASEAVDQPLWTLATATPFLGPNFSAVAEIARSADDVVNLGLHPLAEAYGSLDWDKLLPSSSPVNLEPLESASPAVSSASNAVRMSADRLAKVDETKLLPQVADPLKKVRGELQEVTGTLDTAADASRIAPSMMGSNTPRNYLLMIQNNAEARASGGIPGALAVLTIDQGRLTLTAQSSAGDLGVMSPAVPVDASQQEIYSARIGKFMQDVNLTPDFPTAASTAQAMWERKTGQRVDGVLSIDPVALSYILQSTGPVKLDGPENIAASAFGMPLELSGQNVVQTLLSDVYAKIEQPELQDAYFAAVAKEIFATLSKGELDAKRLLEGITRGTEEGRVLIWSATATEQSVIAHYPIGGSAIGPPVAPAQFGVYFNDGTGAKMDFYMKRTVQLIKECPLDGYEQTTVRVVSTNTAPLDAEKSLPAYVTGGGVFGVPAGAVQTNIVAYGPVQSTVETAKLDGHKTDFAPYVHGDRPVGVYAVQIAPGESKMVDFTFGKIVQHTEPNVFVTPTVQSLTDVVLPTITSSCG
ncbi:DUF4012 domain-containing protein [Arthrobacter sp. S13_S34]|nr:DUF4012 domain-containing protein [Arthrobacter sp. S13_S34]